MCTNCVDGCENKQSVESGDLQRTSRCMCWLSWPMELLAVQRYWPAYVNCTFFKVREETRAWLRTTMFLSRLCGQEETRRQGEKERRREGELGPRSHSCRNKCKVWLLSPQLVHEGVLDLLVFLQENRGNDGIRFLVWTKHRWWKRKGIKHVLIDVMKLQCQWAGNKTAETEYTTEIVAQIGQRNISVVVKNIVKDRNRCCSTFLFLLWSKWQWGGCRTPTGGFGIFITSFDDKKNRKTHTSLFSFRVRPSSTHSNLYAMKKKCQSYKKNQTRTFRLSHI